MAKKARKRSAAAAVVQVPARSAPVWPTVLGATERIRARYEVFATQGKDTLSALVDANDTLSHALGRMSLEWVSLARAMVESAAAAGVRMVDARSFDDVVGVQYRFARECADRLVIGGARFSELGLKAASELCEPMGLRAEKVIEALRKPLAA